MTDGSYFQPAKRGELHELKEELHSSNKEKKKEAVKKVIAAMTVGKDVSSLFPDVVNCMQTTNIELKKLVYLYVINYAKAQPELAILAINTFRKDSLDPNPLIRALAVRTMGCIRLEEITEYLVEPLRRCCKDPDPYVRKTAAICVAKLFDIRPDMVGEEGFIEELTTMLSDSNPVVVANAVAALSEISENSGKSYMKDILNAKESNVNKLLAALNECTEWGQVFILDALAQFEPETPRAAESVLDRVTARLSHANSAVVLSAIKVVMKLLDKVTNPDVVRAVQRKLCPPLVTLLSAEPEIQYVALRNIELIVQKRPNILANEVKMFFCKYNDPVYVKIEKLDILVRLASERNIDQVLNELKEYATEVDVDFVRKAVRSIGRCAIKLDAAAERCVAVLLDLIQTKVNYVVQEAIVVIKDIFRKYPNQYESMISTLCKNLDTLDEPAAKASMVWIVGEYVDRIDNADELLETFLETFHDEPSVVQLQLLTATVKLFLKKPAHTQDLVTKVLKMATEETYNPDLRDRAYIYWRMLSGNPDASKKVVFAPKPCINEDADALDYRTLDKLIGNISLLSSVYHKAPETFVTRQAAPGAARQKEITASSDEDSTDTRVEKAKRDMQRQHYSSDEKEDGDSSSDGSSEQSDSDTDGPTDLLGLNDEAPPSKQGSKPNNDFFDISFSAGPAVAKPVVLTADRPGSQGKTGLEIAAALARFNGMIRLHLSFSNRSQVPLNGWALQFNKNSFGLAPAGPLQVGDLLPGSSTETTVPVVPGQLNSNTAPGQPPSLQVAVKTNLDVFYFTVPFDLCVVLQENSSADKDLFRQRWQAIGEGRQHALMAVAANSQSVQAVIAQLEAINIALVAQRSADTFEALYVSATTTNNLVVLAEVSLQKNGNAVKIVTRSEAAALIPLFNATVCTALRLTVRS
ncbi:putative beta adaptin protein [Besnoitia besnoiti]|uniref:AP complex subunit beta n=1 Tax=Besnoitia besnoiti TaxID=94643 RepID=A0A2A9MGT6_BESBE|nr:putative beta adaptin protein [Besnoitia besnoiti]PFH36364.1 putative beta adaptin protein [Besnoitia besnoiti]